MFKIRRSYVRTFVEILVLVELNEETPLQLSSTQLRQAAVKYAEEQMEDYKFNRIVDHNSDGITILMEGK